jgi:glycosyltransferase involved in cell wall biosynthesis
MKDKSRFLFLRPGPKPFANSCVADVLASSFPEFEVDMVDVRNELKRRPFLLGMMCSSAVWSGGPAVLRSRKALRLALDRTTRVQNWVKEFSTKKTMTSGHRFTFQMQSLFDGSTGKVPHFIYTDHAMLENTNYPGWQQWVHIDRSFLDREKAIYFNADLVFVQSSNVARCLEEQYGLPSSKICCVKAGSNVEFSSSFTNRTYDGRTIVFTGVDWERKGGPCLLKAFRLVREQRPEARLIIVGCSPDVAEDGVEVVGKQPLEAVSRYYEQASIFCMPSLREPFGIVYIEAMTAGLPVIATTLGATPDFVRNGETGYLVPPNDPEALATALLKLVGHPDRCRKFGSAGREIATSDYNWNAVASKMSSAIRAHL